MRFIPFIIVCSLVGFFLWISFDIRTYQLYHSGKESLSSNASHPKNTFIDNVSIQASPGKENWIIDEIDQARQEIKVAVYMFTVPSLMDALLRAHRRGVSVKVVLEKNPYNAVSINREAVQFFKKNSISFHETDNDYFSFMHAKYMVIDGKWFISTANWTRSSFASNREFFVQGQDIRILNNLIKLFEHDFSGNLSSVFDDRLLIGPSDTARQAFIDMFDLSDKSIKIYMPNITDEGIINHVKKLCSKDIQISIILDHNKEIVQKGNEISINGCPDIRMLKNPSLHAKVIIIDDKKSFIGSFNFTKNSLENNRELGLFIDGNSVKKIVNIFQEDWQKSIAF